MECPDCKVEMEELLTFIPIVFKCPLCGIEIEDGEEG